MIVHVEDEVLSHHSQADEADITRCVCHNVSEFLPSPGSVTGKSEVQGKCTGEV
jgi:hypothetical protein